MGISMETIVIYDEGSLVNIPFFGIHYCLAKLCLSQIVHYQSLALHLKIIALVVTQVKTWLPVANMQEGHTVAWRGKKIPNVNWCDIDTVPGFRESIVYFVLIAVIIE